MKRPPKRDPVREDRIENKALVDAGPDEQSMSWYYYLEEKIRFPFQAKCRAANPVSPFLKGECVEDLRMAPEDVCEHDMLVQIKWQGRKMAVPLSQLVAIEPGESTDEAIGDWHYWTAQGYLLLITHAHRKLTIDSGDPSLVYLAVGPQWDSLRADPRFLQCLGHAETAVR